MGKERGRQTIYTEREGGRETDRQRRLGRETDRQTEGEVGEGLRGRDWKRK